MHQGNKNTRQRQSKASRSANTNKRELIKLTLANLQSNELNLILNKLNMSNIARLSLVSRTGVGRIARNTMKSRLVKQATAHIKPWWDTARAITTSFGQNNSKHRNDPIYAYHEKLPSKETPQWDAWNHYRTKTSITLHGTFHAIPKTQNANANRRHAFYASTLRFQVQLKTNPLPEVTFLDLELPAGAFNSGNSISFKLNALWQPIGQPFFDVFYSTSYPFSSFWGPDTWQFYVYRYVVFGETQWATCTGIPFDKIHTLTHPLHAVRSHSHVTSPTMLRDILTRGFGQSFGDLFEATLTARVEAACRRAAEIIQSRSIHNYDSSRFNKPPIFPNLVWSRLRWHAQRGQPEQLTGNDIVWLDKFKFSRNGDDAYRLRELLGILQKRRNTNTKR
jgi:hypothetical protein